LAVILIDNTETDS